MVECREFRGYRDGELIATFPLHWIDNIEIIDGKMSVTYDDELEYNTVTEEISYKTIVVDKIDVK